MQQTSAKQGSGKVDQRTHVDHKAMLHQLTLLERALRDIKSYTQARLIEAEKQSKPLPRIVLLIKEYGFSARETDLFQLMVVAQGSNNTHVLNSLTEEDYMRKVRLDSLSLPTLL